MTSGIDLNRVKKLNSQDTGTGPVVYWMSRDQRIRDNWALLYAQELALAKKQPLVVVFCLVPEFLGAALRQYRFMLQGLAELEQDLRKLKIAFSLLTGNPVEKIPGFCRETAAGALVCDFSPLRIQTDWKEKVASNLPLAFFEVDAHNIVPCRLASSKQEYAAYTFRPKINKLLPVYLTDIPAPQAHPYPSAHLKQGDQITDWKAAENALFLGQSVPPVSGFKPGETAGREAMEHFISNKLPFYDRDRNDPILNGQSNLSPYLHFGQLSAQRLACAISRAGAGEGSSLEASKEAYLEELVVRRELSDNYCFYNRAYDSTAGFPRWARETMEVHRNDPREYIYPLADFEGARTHDQLWNAAQNEMVYTGKMHGYMRMYWAKKILEWTQNPEQAMEFAIYLNDKYSLDGRDPNGYSGVAWSIGGVHDRAWGERPVFGKVRYMSYKGSKSKFNIEAYISKVRAFMDG